MRALSRQMEPAPPFLVVLVEDDEALRSALTFSIELEGLRVTPFGAGEDLLEAELPDHDVCLVVDERLPGIGGLEAIQTLRRRGNILPAVLITSHPKARLLADAKAAGVPILEKPLLGNALMGWIRTSLEA